MHFAFFPPNSPYLMNDPYVYVCMYVCMCIYIYIYIYNEMMGCGESNGMIEICRKLDKSNT